MIKIKNHLKIKDWSKKKLILVSIIIIAVLVAVFFLNKNTASQAASTDYATSTVRKGTIEYSIDGSGTLEPSERYSLKTWSSGTVTEIMVTAGAKVTEGQPMMTVVNDVLNSSAKQASLEWSIAQSDLSDMYNPPAEDDYERRSAELKVQQYKIALQDSIDERDHLTIIAPFDGTLIDNEFILGQRVNSGVTAASFATADDMEVVAAFSDRDINSISSGQVAQITVKGLNKTYTGTVKEVAFEGDATSGEFEVIITIDNPDEILRAGMSTYNNVTIVRDMDQDVFIYKGGSGYLRYAQSEDIVTEVSGTVAEIYHAPGDRILKGEPILRLENNELDRQVDEAELQLANAEETLRLILDPDEDTVKAQELKVEQAYQKVVNANKNLDSLNVVSPIDGIVTSISVSVGDELGEDTSSSGQELIVVCNFDKNYLEISIDELDINKIEFDQTAVVKIDALPKAVATGKVVGIAQEGTSSNGVTTYPITLEVDYVEGIKGGMSATATILIDKKENVLTIPAESLVTNNNKEMVRVLEKGQVMLKPVQTGLNNGTWVEIIKGLNENDQIIVAQTSTDSNTLQIMPGGFGGMGSRPPTGAQRRND
ncbi:MAG: hypothetical protein CVU87_00640 [Firmicutes bacterium HGW-Firmicutes-12]|nr:MAG: hypothetical protein CVU87_00640 [Firmicutes bacterium HGW-Firmicutes-12]